MKIKTGDRRFDFVKYPTELREAALEAVAAGESMASVARETAIPYSTLTKWVRKSGAAGDARLARRVSAELEKSLLAAAKAQTAAFTRMAATETLRGASAAQLAGIVRATHAFVVSMAQVMNDSQDDRERGGDIPQWRASTVGADHKY